MIVETGHYALVLALAMALMQTALPFWGARARDARLMALARPVALTQFALVALSYAALTYAHVVVGFLAGQCGREFAFDQAVDLQDRRRLGQSRGIDDALGAHPHPERRRHGGVLARHSAAPAGATHSPFRACSASPSCCSSC